MRRPWWPGRRQEPAVTHQPCPHIPCTHCDQPCDNTSCEPCRSVSYGTQMAAAVLAARPAPTRRELHDMGGTGSLPVGAVGRCAACGGRTYQLLEGPWCPRAGCTT